MGASIYQLSQRAISLAASIPFYDPSSGADGRDTVSDLVALIASSLQSAAGSAVTQYFAPNATGWSALVAPPVSGEDVYLLVTPTAGFAAGTITLPAQASCVDGQTLLVSCTQLVTALTVAGNGATAVNGAPTTLAANGFFELRYDGPSNSWFRVG